MDKKVNFTIEKNVPLAKDVYALTLSGDTGNIRAPGQFVNVELPGHFLRRPLSVCDWAEGELKLIYKVLGQGTAELAEFHAGEQLDVLMGLGNGFNVRAAGEHPVLVGGGVGVPPLFALAKALIAQGKTPDVVLGFNTADDVFYDDEFAALGLKVAVCTVDAGRGHRGMVTDVLPPDADYLFACGPVPMLRALDALPGKGQLSMEERMGCGFGACMGCSIRTTRGTKRVCKEGPIFLKGEILWDLL